MIFRKAELDHLEWLNVCIGERNLPLFLLFLFIHSVCSGYTGVLAFLSFAHIADEKSLFNARFMDARGRKLEASLLTVARVCCPFERCIF
jgi:hypothetical protein